MESLTLGVVRRSRKENEQRVPLHPAHLEEIPSALRERMVFERGYGEPFGTSDEELRRLGASLADRAEILGTAGVVLLAKPTHEDLHEIREGGILWGWPHCVQQEAITQEAIDRRLTLLAWEEMHLWRGEVRDMHLFYRNNEMAGYAGVIHALACAGLDGCYGEELRSVVLSFGSVSRGAIRALRGRGFGNVSVFTQRPTWAVRDQVMGCRFARMVSEDDRLIAVGEDGRRRPLADVLTEADVIVNGILQDTERPLMFLREDEVARLRPGTLIVDVSCDEGMGFPFAKPTTFEQPTFPAGGATYYAVDHSPSYLWRSASWEISRAVVPFVEKVLGGPEAWDADQTLSRCIEIREGVVQNERILTFQDRAPEYPHAVRK